MKHAIFLFFLCIFARHQDSYANPLLKDDDDFPILKTLRLGIQGFNDGDGDFIKLNVPTPAPQNPAPILMRDKLILKVRTKPSADDLFPLISEDIGLNEKIQNINQIISDIMDVNDCLNNAYGALYNHSNPMGLLRSYPRKTFDSFYMAYQAMYQKFLDVVGIFDAFSSDFSAAIICHNPYKKFLSLWQDEAKDSFDVVLARMTEIQIQFIALYQNNALNFRDFLWNSDGRDKPFKSIPQMIGAYDALPTYGQPSHGLYDMLKVYLRGRRSVSIEIQSELICLGWNALQDYKYLLGDQNNALIPSLSKIVKKIGITPENWATKKKQFYNADNLFHEGDRVMRCFKKKNGAGLKKRLLEINAEVDKNTPLWNHLKRKNFYQEEGESPHYPLLKKAINIFHQSRENLINSVNLFRLIYKTILSTKVISLGKHNSAVGACLNEMKASNGDVSRLTFDALIRAKEGYWMMEHTLKFAGKWDEFESAPLTFESLFGSFP